MYVESKMNKNNRIIFHQMLLLNEISYTNPLNGKQFPDPLEKFSKILFFYIHYETTFTIYDKLLATQKSYNKMQ